LEAGASEADAALLIRIAQEQLNKSSISITSYELNEEEDS
jgi:hypothetical protein